MNYSYLQYIRCNGLFEECPFHPMFLRLTKESQVNENVIVII